MSGPASAFNVSCVPKACGFLDSSLPNTLAAFINFCADRAVQQTHGQPRGELTWNFDPALAFDADGRARNRTLDLAPAIQKLQAAGCASLRAIAAGLEERGIPAPRGGKWSAVQVA